MFNTNKIKNYICQYYNHFTIMAESSFPKSLDFSPQPLSISARAYTAKCVPESSSTARPNEIVRIRIPSGRAGSYLNNSKSFLSFNVVNESKVAGIEDATVGLLPIEAIRDSKLVLDGSAYAVLQTQEVYNSSNLLESIQNANVLYNILVDLQTSMGSRLTGSSILGIGATGVNSQMWNKYHGATQSGIINNESKYAFNEVVSRLGTIYCGLNILSASRDPGTGAEVNNVIVETEVQAGPAVDNDKAPFDAYPGPVYMDSVYGPVGVLNTSPVFKGQVAALDAGACGVDGFISRLGPVIPYGQKQRFTLPLVSGVVGSLCCKLFPLHALNSDLMLHLTLASTNTAVCNNYIPTSFDPTRDATIGGLTGNDDLIAVAYRVEEIAFHANIVEVSAAAQAMLDQATGGQYVIPSCSYRNFTHTLGAGQSNNEFPVPARFTSIKSMIACQRPSASLDRPDRFSLTSRIKNHMTAIQYRVGSLLVPQEPIRMSNIDPNISVPRSGYAPEAFCHLLEAVGQCVADRSLECGMNDAIYGANHDGVDYNYGGPAGDPAGKPTDWVAQASVGTGVAQFDAAGDLTADGQSDKRFYNRMAQGSRAGFCWGVDLESFNTAVCHGPMQSGTNTLGLNIMCRLYADRLTCESGATVDTGTQIVATTVDHFVLFDQVLVVSGGVCSTRF
jgi:hypothetical protein